MRGFYVALVAFSLWTSPLPAQQPKGADEPARFSPVKVISVADVTYPISSGVFATVVLEARVDPAGKTEDVKVIRGYKSLTPVAIASIKSWTFEPATLDGKPTDSTMRVAVTFYPPTLFATDVPLPPLRERGDKRKPQFRYQPPQVVAASFPKWPTTCIVYGTVALEVTINEAGTVAGGVRILHDIPPLTAEAIHAIKDWKFTSATFDGEPITSRMVLAFVFTLPHNNRR